MGCDIHCFVEKINKRGLWSPIKHFISSLYEPGNKYFETDEFKDVISPIDQRNYRLFGLLAGVRNGIGFAGITTGSIIVPISLPKGLPYNVSNEVRKESDDWGIDGHSHSWLTVKEILNYDFDYTYIVKGMIDSEQAKIFLKEGKPHHWTSYISRRDIRYCNLEEIIENQKKDKHHTYYCEVEWKVSLKDEFNYFLNKQVKQLKERCNRKDYSDVRIVFWFDN